MSHICHRIIIYLSYIGGPEAVSQKPQNTINIRQQYTTNIRQGRRHIFVMFVIFIAGGPPSFSLSAAWNKLWICLTNAFEFSMGPISLKVFNKYRKPIISGDILGLRHLFALDPPNYVVAVPRKDGEECFAPWTIKMYSGTHQNII